MIKSKSRILPKKLTIGAEISKTGLHIFVNGERFSIEYPAQIWKKTSEGLKNMLKDNIGYSSTLFLPQILNIDEINYKTNRPISETFLFENGICDMPCTAISDGKSSILYIKNFFNIRHRFASPDIKMPVWQAKKKTANKKLKAVIPFSFGKESLISLGLCQELGIQPILVNFIEPANDFEYQHKKKLITKFEKEFNIKVYTVKYNPGALRYGKYWGLKTELGWGLQTTEYSLLALPLVEFFGADFIILGNEKSCDDTFINSEDVLTYKAGYDQHSDWTPQQGLLASLILGRKIQVFSLVEPLYELAITKILHRRYPRLGAYQMSCMADTENAKKNRWCQNCVKCSYIYGLLRAFDTDLKKIGFTEDLFDAKHLPLYDYFFNYEPLNPQYGSQEELGLAFYLALKKGVRGAAISRFEKELGKSFQKNKQKYLNTYLGINSCQNIPADIKPKLFAIYKEELKNHE